MMIPFILVITLHAARRLAQRDVEGMLIDNSHLMLKRFSSRTVACNVLKGRLEVSFPEVFAAPLQQCISGYELHATIEIER